MKKTFKKIFLILLSLMFVFSSSYSNILADELPQVESATIPITRDENSLTPFTYVTGSPGLQVMRLVYDSLATLDLDNQVVPWMAKSIDVSDDNREFTISLSEGLKWHDGEKVTLEDVKFSFEYPSTQEQSTWKSIVKNVEALEIVDNQLVIKLIESQPSFLIEGLAALPIIPKHIYENVEDASIFDGTVGSGMYEIIEYIPGTSYVLEAQDDYFKGKPKIKQINMPIINDNSTIYTGLKMGEFLTFTGSLTADLLEEFSNNDNVEVITDSGLTSTLLYWNIDREPFDNVDFRKALSLAIDNDTLIENIYLGFADAGLPGFYSPASPFANKDIVYESNIAQAEELLDSIGYSEKDAEGFRLNADGHPLKFELLTGNKAEKIRMAEIIASNLEKIGIQIEVISYEQDTLDSYVWPDFDASKPVDYDMSIFGWSAPVMLKESMLTSLLSIPEEAGIYNLTKYRDTDYLKLEKEFLAEENIDKRADLMKEIQVLMSKTYPFHVIAYPNIISVYNSSIYNGFKMQKGQGIINVYSFIE